MTRERAADLAGRVAWGAILAVVGFAPLVITNLTGLGIGRYPFTYDQIHLVRTVVVQVAAWVALAGWALAASLARGRVRVHASLILLAGFLAFAALSTATSRYRAIAVLGEQDHYEGLLQLLAYAALTFAALQLADPSRLRRLARWVSVCGALVGAFGILQALGLDRTNWLSGVIAYRAFSTLGNPDYLGGYLAFPLAFALAVAIGDEDRRWRAAGAVCAAFAGVALVATMTRGAWAAGLLVVLIMGIAFARKRYVWLPLAAGAAGVLVASVVAFSVTSGGTLVRRLADAFASGDSGLAARVTLWKLVARVVANTPLLGGGPDAFSQASVAAIGVAVSHDAHDYPLQLAVTVGVPATLLLYAFFVWVLWRSARPLFARERHPADLMLAAAWAASLGYLVHLMASLSMTVTTAQLFVCLGLILAGVSSTTGPLPRTAVVACALALVMVAGTIVIGAFGIAADHEFLQARIAAHDGGDRVGPARRAVELNPFQEGYRIELQRAIAASKK